MAITAPAPRVLADVVAGTWVRTVALVLGGAAFVGLAAQVAIPLPFTPVPLTLQTFAVLLAGAALGTARGSAAMAVYLVAALAGVPWVAPNEDGTHTTGLALLEKPSFGYLLGFIVAAAIVGRYAERGATRTPLRTAGLMLLGSAIVYAIGATYLALSLGIPFLGAESAWAYGIQPFLVGDLLKLAAASALLPAAWRLVGRFAGDR